MPAGYGFSRFLVAVDAVSVLVTVVSPTPPAGALMAAALLFAVLLRGPVTAADTA